MVGRGRTHSLPKPERGEDEDEDAENVEGKESGEDPTSKIIPTARWIWEAFSLLSAQRTHEELIPNPISMSDISGYCSIEGFRAPDRVFLRDLVVELDLIYVKEVSEKVKRAIEKARKRKKRTT